VAEAVPASGHDTIEASQDEILAEPAAAEAEDGGDDHDDHEEEEAPPPETIGGEGPEESDGEGRAERRIPPRFLRHYKIQEVIRRRQIMLVQVVKEERGTKGAALTTYLSLAGRFGVLMPNSPRGGGISRKITSAADRRRLREVMQELDIPRGMGMIIRTAGASRPKPEIKRDCEYLLRLWDDIREHTMKSVAPALIYEEASLIKRSIRDVYSRDIEEILVDGEEGWRAAHDFMRMLMPSHAKKVQLWRDGGQPLLARNQVETQLDAMMQPIVQLRSGGYLVINQAEALVAIDVNSGRSTRERNIEETALRTNLEAADEAARQLRLRDLAGLIVIDFIDMESKRHNAMVERRLKEALKNDRARIQVGHISHFGLLEMSRQRLRPSLAETSMIACPHCGGTGHVRSTEGAAIHVLRGIEDEGSRRRTAEVIVHVPTAIALYLLNHKRERIREIEQRYAMRVVIAADDSQVSPVFRIERVRAYAPGEAPTHVTPETSLPMARDYSEDDEPNVVDEVEEADAEADAEVDEERETESETRPEGASASEEEERRRRRRRRRRRGGRREDGTTEDRPDGEPAGEDEGPAEAAAPEEAPAAEEAHIEGVPEHTEPTPEAEDDGRDRRRNRRGGRSRSRGRGRRDGEEIPPVGLPGAEQPDLQPVYTGPTPADPFGGRVFDIFDVMDQVEQSEAARTIPSRAGAPESTELTPGADEPVAIEAAPAPEAVVPPPVEAAPVAPEPEPVAVAPLLEPVTEIAAAPEPAVAVAEAAPEPANDVIAEPAIKPIVIGSGDEPPAQKKRGWWRRG
jgi:ribonuclease E